MINSSPRLIQFLFLVSLCATVRAQQAPMTQSTRDVINLGGLKVPANGGILYGFDNTPRQVTGDTYIDTVFAAGNIHFYSRIAPGSSDSLMGVPIRLDLLSNELEIRAAANDIRVAKGPSVKWFDINNTSSSVSRYINVREFRGDTDDLSGFLEWMQPGRLNLMAYHYVRLKKGDYNAALNIGSRDEQMLKKIGWYVVQNGRSTLLMPTKKNLLALMVDKKEQVDQFLHDKDPNLKTQAGLQTVFAFYNNL